MREIDRMMELRARVRDESERRKIDDAIEALDTSFQARIGLVSNYILNGRAERPDLRAVRRRMADLRSVGKRYGVEFPAFQNEREASAYAQRYGREIVLGDS